MRVEAKSPREAVRRLGFEETPLLIKRSYEPYRTTLPLPRREGMEGRGTIDRIEQSAECIAFATKRVFRYALSALRHAFCHPHRFERFTSQASGCAGGRRLIACCTTSEKML